MSNKNEVMGFALYGHLTALIKMIDGYYNKVIPLTGEDPDSITTRERLSAEFYRDFTNMLARNNKLWSFDYLLDLDEETHHGITLFDLQEKFNNLTQNLLIKTILESYYILDYINRLPLSEMVSRTLLSAVNVSTYFNPQLRNSGVARYTSSPLNKAYKQSLKKQFLDQDNSLSLDFEKGYLDSNDLCKSYTNLLSKFLTLNSDKTTEFNISRWQPDRWSPSVPDKIIESPHTNPETIDTLLDAVTKIPNLDRESLIHDLDVSLYRAVEDVTINDVACLIDSDIHPAIAFEGGSNYYAERYIDKQFILVDYLIKLSPDLDDSHSRIIETIASPYKNIGHVAAVAYRQSLNNQDKDYPLNFDFIKSTLSKLTSRGVRLDGSDEIGNDALDSLKKGLKSNPEAIAEIEHHIFMLQRPLNDTPEVVSDSVGHLNAFSI